MQEHVVTSHAPVVNHKDLVTLTAFMADEGYSAQDVAYAVEKPWKHGDILADARLAEDEAIALGRSGVRS